jgi:transaldolase
MGNSRLHKLSELDQSVWIDSISRGWIKSGFLRKLIDEDAVVGVTSNPTIFEKAIASGDAYDEQMREVMTRTDDPKEIFWELAITDIKDACDILRPIWDEGSGKDGYVSLEVDPTLAADREATLAEAMHLHEAVDKANLFVKIPATEAGLGAIEDSIARGKSINVTLIFSLDRYRAVVEAYIRGLERLVDDGGDPRRVASVASFFVSRVDTEADKRLEAIGTEEALALRGKLAIANAKLAYEHYGQAFSDERWARLAAAGATPQRCLWASTSTKNPEYRDVIYVEELLGPETVNTMPLETIEAFQDHGEVQRTLDRGLEEARQVLADLERVGVDYADVTDTIEREGVEKFAASFDELLEGIRAKRGELAAA